MRIGASNRLIWLAILLLIGIQFWFVWTTRPLRPGIDDMPQPPTMIELKAMAFGDDEFLFRYLARWLQDVGDGGGRFIPLRFMDYDRVIGWMKALDRLDPGESDYVHLLAARFYGGITRTVDIRNERLQKIVGYLRLVGLSDPVKRWHWLVWSAGKARNPINNKTLVKLIARDLQSPELRSPLVPAWVRVLPITLFQFAGDTPAAEAAAASVTDEDKDEIRRDRQNMIDATEFTRRQRPDNSIPAK